MKSQNREGWERPPRSSSPGSTSILSTQGLLFPFGILFTYTCSVDSTWIMDPHSQRCVFLERMAGLGRGLGSVTTLW